MKKALSVAEVINYKPKILEFTGLWADAIGKPEPTGSWIIWGNSGNGKTQFALMLAKYLAEMGMRVVYNSLEEGRCESIKKAFQRINMISVNRRMWFLDQEPVDELSQRLKARKSPDVVFIDSVQYSGLNYTEYKKLRSSFRNKLFVLISHAEGREPAGTVAKKIRFDAFVKIYIDGYVAFPVSRYGGGKTFDIWPERNNETK